MSTDGETAALVALLRLGQRSETEYLRLAQRMGSAWEALQDELAFDRAQARLLAEDPHGLVAEARADLGGWREAGIGVLSPFNAGYPANLRQLESPPPLVFIVGRLEVDDERAIALIGSRRASAEGIRITERFAAGFVAAGYTVISGLAAGIDSAAHESALRSGGRTIAVIGTGVQRCYPPENAPLQQRIAETGAVMSQFWPDAPPRPGNFPLRNGTMAGVSRGSVIVEASERSGARIQARLSRGHGRPVFLLDRLLMQEWARELAARDGVHVVSAPDEVTERLRADPGHERVPE